MYTLILVAKIPHAYKCKRRLEPVLGGHTWKVRTSNLFVFGVNGRVVLPKNDSKYSTKIRGKIHMYHIAYIPCFYSKPFKM